MENKRILVIDDEADVLEFLKLFLETEGYQVTIAQNCKLALDLFRNQDFFLVITDIAMPDKDGYEITDEMFKIKPLTSFVVMTGFGYNANHSLVKVKENCDCPCIFKPFNRKKLIEVVTNASKIYINKTTLKREKEDGKRD